MKKAKQPIQADSNFFEFKQGCFELSENANMQIFLAGKMFTILVKHVSMLISTKVQFRLMGVTIVLKIFGRDRDIKLI